MSRVLPLIAAGSFVLLACGRIAAGNDPPDAWPTSYAKAMEAAKRDAKMILIYFHDPGGSEPCEQFAQETLSDPVIVDKLKDFVTVRLPLDATIRVAGEEVALLEHFSFREMSGTPGVAILDFAHQDADHYGHVVGAFPFVDGRPYTADELAVVLDLPSGTLTQRALIYAVRTHPDRPASAEGKLDPYLLDQAMRHSQHQARIRRQGHHNWQGRFQRITAKLPDGLVACEVCAESWPGENLIEAAVECVRCWRLSSGHWSAVRAGHLLYAYDMKRGSNRIWYATGIFGQGPEAATPDEESVPAEAAARGLAHAD
jgi:hypothetical protein